MARQKSFDSILRGLKKRKKFERELAEKSNGEKCTHCGCHMQAVGRSSIQGICRNCAHLALNLVN